MDGFIKNTRHLAQAASYFLGFVTIGAAVSVLVFSKDPLDLANWALNVLGLTFVSLLAALVFLSVFSLIRLRKAEEHHRQYWLEVGVQAANGVTTLALTFTLLGISLGIGSLAGQELTPETVQAVIREVTANFSLAFMTTVIGLPVSAFLRSVLIISGAEQKSVTPVSSPSFKKENGYEIFDV